jgi:branched-chain amino acid aminotransferase
VITRRAAGLAVLDGRPVEADALVLPWDDPAAQWGLGIFETIAVHEGRPKHQAAHLIRLRAAADECAVPLPGDAELLRALRNVGAAIPEGHGWTKILVSRSGRWAVFGNATDRSREDAPCAAVILRARRHRLDPLTGTKTLAYAASILGLEEARRKGADEGLWLNDRGHVIGASAANVFVVKGRAVTTPAVSDGARPGVTRERAIAALRAQGVRVAESRVRVLKLRSADEIFLTSSLLGVRAVVRLDGSDVRGGWPGPVTRRLADALAEDEAPTRDVVHDTESRG